MISVTRAPSYLTVQDLGREHSRAFGVPRAGAMDRFALQALNTIVGNATDAAVLEWALGGGTLKLETDCVFALGGARARAALSGDDVPPFTTIYASAGDELTIEQLTAGRFLYIALAGGIDVPVILGSRATYLPGRFGGYAGRLIARGDSIQTGDRPTMIPARGFVCPAELLPNYGSSVVRVTRGTHADMFSDAAWRAFTGAEFIVSQAADRTGYKLQGNVLPHSMGSLPSDVGCQGAIQVPGEGTPIVLMADAPTVGGYPKIAVVAEADLPILSQRSPGEVVRFELITIEQSQRALRRRASDLNTIRSAGAASA
ncbi:MAG: biotin-dependent carboxyltransferase family protein [Gemmatimonadaceae bacterium]